MEPKKSQEEIKECEIKKTYNFSMISSTDSGRKTIIDLLVEKYAKFDMYESMSIELKVLCKYLYTHRYLIPLCPTLEEQFVYANMNYTETKYFQGIDNVLIIVDICEGITPQIELELSKIVTMQIRPILIINKLDRAMLEFQSQSEVIYEQLCYIIDKANEIIGSKAEIFPKFDPTIGNVIFASAKYSFGITIPKMAEIYALKFAVNINAMSNKLWGNNYYNNFNRSWQNIACVNDKPTLKKSFCQFVLEPVKKLMNALFDGDVKNYERMLTCINVYLKIEEKSLKKHDLVKAALSKWFPLYETIMISMKNNFIPSNYSQNYRFQQLFINSVPEKIMNSIKSCDENGNLVGYSFKFLKIWPSDKFGIMVRIFSGKIKSGQFIKLIFNNENNVTYSDNFTRTSDFKHIIAKTDLLQKGGIQVKVEKIFKRYEKGFMSCECASCPEIIFITGLSLSLPNNFVDSFTITDGEFYEPIREVTNSTPMLVKAKIDLKDTKNDEKFNAHLWDLKIQNSFLNVKNCLKGGVYIESCNEHLTNELCGLIETMPPKLDLAIQKPPVFSFRETVISKTTLPVKITNKDQKIEILCSCEPLDISILNSIISDSVILPKLNQEMLMKKHNLSEYEAINSVKYKECLLIISEANRKIWDFDIVRNCVICGFKLAVNEGILNGEEIRATLFKIDSLIILSDLSDSNLSQELVQMTMNSMHLAEKSATPKLQIPYIIAQITCPSFCLNAIYTKLTTLKCDKNTEETINSISSVHIIRTKIPYAYFENLQKEITLLGKENCKITYVFSHWQTSFDEIFTSEHEFYKTAYSISQISLDK